eukprot:COSAG01_NODE_21812_length_883_cov_20.834184_1_plen_187_part_00
MLGAAVCTQYYIVTTFYICKGTIPNWKQQRVRAFVGCSRALPTEHHPHQQRLCAQPQLPSCYSEQHHAVQLPGWLRRPPGCHGVASDCQWHQHRSAPLACRAQHAPLHPRGPHQRRTLPLASGAQPRSPQVGTDAFSHIVRMAPRVRRPAPIPDDLRGITNRNAHVSRTAARPHIEASGETSLKPL